MALILQPIQKNSSSGNNNTRLNTFYSTHISCNFPEQLDVFQFLVPQFSTFGGTVHYYSQEPNSIFTNFNSPFIRYEFTANTFSLSADTEIVHQFFKLSFDDYDSFDPEFVSTVTEDDIKEEKSDETEVIIENGKRRTIRKISTKINDVGRDVLTQEDIEGLLEQPFYETSFPATGVTVSPVYDYIPGQFIKTTGTTAGEYQQELFEDKSQYFVKTFFRFKVPEDPLDLEPRAIVDDRDIGELNVLLGPLSSTTDVVINTSNSTGQRFTHIPVPKLSARTYDTVVPSHVITGETFNGTVVGGNFFTYFTVPNKPEFEEPFISGMLDTFSPKLFFSNVQDGDEYLIEVVYDISDTGFTTSEKFSYTIDKELFDTNIQEAVIPLKTNAEFRYRIGNVKVLRNVFDVDQKIVTFSDQLTGKTQPQAANVFVQTQSDSPYSPALPNFSTPPSLTPETPGIYSLSGAVSGSTVTGATIDLIGGGVTVTQTTNLLGEFVFTGVSFGTYTLETTYRGYKKDSRQLQIQNSNKVGYCIQILWDNEFDTWASKEDDIIKF